MARIMSVDSTEIYRMLVTRKMDNGKSFQTAFGPHGASSSARDYTFNSYWGDQPARKEKQKLVATDYMTLKWITIKTTYTDGGEDVDWDE